MLRNSGSYLTTRNSPLVQRELISGYMHFLRHYNIFKLLLHIKNPIVKNGHNHKIKKHGCFSKHNNNKNILIHLQNVFK